MALWRASSRSNSLWRAIRLSFTSERLILFLERSVKNREGRVRRLYPPTKGLADARSESHRRSLWIVYTPPTKGLADARCESHQRSWLIVHTRPTKGLADARCESHQRSWWIVHTRPTMQQPAQQFL